MFKSALACANMRMQYSVIAMSQTLDSASQYFVQSFMEAKEAWIARADQNDQKNVSLHSIPDITADTETTSFT